jgi:hypothetical protein
MTYSNEQTNPSSPLPSSTGVEWYPLHGMSRFNPFFINLRLLKITRLRTFNDMLVSHCAPAWQGRQGDLSWEPGTIAHWRWLGYDRYFPANAPPHAVGRCISVSPRNGLYGFPTLMASLPYFYACRIIKKAVRALQAPW